MNRYQPFWGAAVLDSHPAYNEDGQVVRPILPPIRYVSLPFRAGQYQANAYGTATATPYASYVNVRAAHVAAAAAEGAAYCDLYNNMRNLILNGVVPDMSSVYTQARAWHVASANQHLNQFGQEIVAQSVFATVSTQPGWLDDLRQ